MTVAMGCPHCGDTVRAGSGQGRQVCSCGLTAVANTRPNPSGTTRTTPLWVNLLGLLVVVILAAAIGLAIVRDDPGPARASGIVTESCNP